MGYLALYGFPFLSHSISHISLPARLVSRINGSMKRDFSLETIRNYSAMVGMRKNGIRYRKGEMDRRKGEKEIEIERSDEGG